MSVFSILLMLTSLVSAGPSGWELTTGPGLDTFNAIGVNRSNPEFAIAVGNAGQIMHINADNSGTSFPSGTDADLFDVFVATPNQALASGQDVVLQWDGTNWSTLIQDDFQVTYAPVWHPPERDMLLYGVLETGAVCPANFQTGREGFCRIFQSRALTFCGRSNDIKIMLSNGEIWHVDNILNDPVDPLSTLPLFTPNVNLNLTAVWVPRGSCFRGATLPAQLFGINAGNEFYKFEDGSWSSMGTVVPDGQTMSWLSGTGPDNIVAGGFEAPAAGGPAENQGVAWLFDGAAWSQDLTLPPGTPGLADVAVAYLSDMVIFQDDYEPDSLLRQTSEPLEKTTARMAGELGQVLINAQLPPNLRVDLAVRVLDRFGVEVEKGTLKNPNLYDQLMVELTNKNSLSATTGIFEGFFAGFTSTDCDDFARSGGTLRGPITLQPGQTFTCNVSLPEPRSLNIDVFIYPASGTDVDWTNNFVFEN